MVYVTYIFDFLPTPFKAISLKRRFKDKLNQLTNSVFTIERKCRNFLFHTLKQSVSHAKQIVSACDTELKSVY